MRKFSSSNRCSGCIEKRRKKFNGITYVESFSGDLGSGYNIGLDDGQEITIFNVKQKGSDAYLGNVIINRSSVVFILSDGTSFSLPRKDGQIHFSSYEAITVNLLDTVEVLLPESFKKSDFAAFTAKVESGDGVATKAGDDDDDWKVKAIAPEFDAQGVLVKNPFVIFTRIPYEKTDAIINVSIIDNNGSKTGTSRVVYSGNFDKRDKVFEEWDALFESDMQKWNELHRMEFVIWYMMSLSEDQKEEDYNEFVNSFVASHSDLIARTLLIDRAGPAAKSLSQIYKEEMEESGDLDEDEEENNEEYMGVPLNGSLGMIDTGGKFYNWMGAGHRGWGLKTGLPDNRKVCHVALPAARDALSEKPIIPSEVGKIPALALFRLFRYQNVNMDYMFDRGVRVFDFHVGMHEGDLHGFSSIFPCQAKVEDEMNVLTNYLNKYPSEFAVLIVTAAGPSSNAWDDCHRFFYNYSQSHPAARQCGICLCCICNTHRSP